MNLNVTRSRRSRSRLGPMSRLGMYRGNVATASVPQAPGALQTGFDAENISMALELTSKACVFHTTCWAATESKLRSDLATQPLAMNNHYRGIEPSNFAADRRLALFDVLSTNQDRQGRPFVSTMGKLPNLYGRAVAPREERLRERPVS